LDKIVNALCSYQLGVNCTVPKNAQALTSCNLAET